MKPKKTAGSDLTIEIPSTQPIIKILEVYRPNGKKVTYKGEGLYVDVTANGALLVLDNEGKAWSAFSSGQWLTVNIDPI